MRPNITTTHTFSLCWRDIFIPFHHIIIIRFAYRYAQLSIIACLTGVLFRFFVHAYIPCASSISFPFLVLICRSLTPHRCALLWLAENLFTEKTLFICANWAGPRAKSHTSTPTHRHSRLTVQLEQRRGKKGAEIYSGKKKEDCINDMCDFIAKLAFSSCERLWIFHTWTEKLHSAVVGVGVVCVCGKDLEEKKSMTNLPFERNITHENYM